MKNIFYIFIFFINIAFSQNWVQTGTWSNPVSGGEAIVDNELIYVLGGFSETQNKSTDEIRIYNTITNNWQNKTSMEEKRSYFTSGVYNDSIFFFGGVPGNDDDAKTIEMWNKVNKPEEYDEDDSFSRINTAGLILGNKFYFFGGVSNVSNPYYLVEYDIPGETITYHDSTIFSQMPTQQMCATDGRYIYLFGGVFLGVSKNIYKYDPSDKTFVKLNIKLHTARAGGKAVAVGNKIIIIGGYNEVQKALSTTEIFTISNGVYSITSGPDLSIPRKDFMSANLKGTIFILGGVDTGGQAVNNIEKLSGITDVKEKDFLVSDAYLEDNYPNPFNPLTTISFSLKKRGFVNLSVFDITGRQITVIINKELPEGSYKEIFNTGTYNLPSGIYLYRLKADAFLQTKKMVLIK